MSLRLVGFALVVAFLGQFLLAQDAPASQPAKVQPVDFRKLKEVMPSTLLNQPQRKNEGEKVSAGEVLFSHATAEYGSKEPGDDAPSITLEIIDYAATKAMADAATGWQNIQIDRDADDGWEKTLKVKDQPALMTFQNEGRNGQLQVFVAGRYYVHVQTNNISSDEFKKIVDQLPIEKLVALK